jgi:transcriptional regulator with XRE-family HTH domain
MAVELGRVIKSKREMRSLSVARVAKQAEVSPAYLSKLESGIVKKPSPNVLHRLAKALSISYVDLMRFAGYVVPSDKFGRAGTGLSTALLSENLTDEETEQLIAYLKFIRQRQVKTR